MSRIVGTAPNQIPTNGDLGSAAYINHEDLPVSTAQAAALAGKADVSHAHTVEQVTGLGDSATRDVGTTSGTVAAGNDSRIVNAVPNTRTVTGVGALTGGGSLASNRTIDASAATKASLAKADTAVQPEQLGDSASLNVGTTAGTVAAGDDSRITGAAQKSANLSDLTNSSTARTNLGLGTVATRDVGTGLNDIPTVSYVDTQKVISDYSTINNNSSGSLVIGQPSESLNLISGLQVGFRLDIVGPLTINTPSGETLRSQNESNSVVEDGGATLIKLNSNTWWLAGNLE